jgi:nuclear transport factor 2 (NTF2) superfamily protein
MLSPKIIVPPFTLDSATAKVRAAEDAWNSRDLERVALAYSENSEWRNRDTFLVGRDAIRVFLASKWRRELDYRLAKSLWAFTENRIAVRFQYEWRDAESHWHRSYGNELWEFDELGLMRRREASINDLHIREEERRFRWAAPGARPATQEDIEALH